MLAATTALTAGCGIVESEPDQFLVVYDEVEQPADTRLTVEAFFDGRQVVLRDEDLRARTDQFGTNAHGRIGPLPTRGVLRARVTAVRPPADTIGVADLAYTLGEGRQYLLAASITRVPLPWFGPVRWISFPLRGSAAGSGDSLWVRYSNEVPCRGCVY